jgi:predicted secreted protein
MAGTKAIGAKLSYDDGGVKYIAHLTSVTPPKLNNADIDVTDHDSAGGQNEYIAGAQSYDNVPFKGNVVEGDDTFDNIWALAQARTEKDFTLETADGAIFEFSGYFASVNVGEQTTDGLIGYEGEIKVSGEVTFNAGS